MKKNYGQPSQPQAAAGRNFPFSVPKGTSPSPCRQVLVVKNFFVRRRRVLRRLRAKSSLIVLTSEILGVQHEAIEKLAI